MISIRQCVILLMISMSTADFPSFVKICKRDSNISECVKENMLRARSHLPAGIPRLYMLPTDPFILSSLDIVNPGLKIELSQLQVRGLHDFEVAGIDVDLDKNSFFTELNFPQVAVDGNYKMSGRILALQLNGAGRNTANMTNVNVKVKMSGGRKIRDGKSYLDFTQHEVRLKMKGDGQVYFDNLFPNEELTKNTNKVLNENIREVLDELRPVLEEVVVGIIWQGMKTLFNKVSVEELFP